MEVNANVALATVLKELNNTKEPTILYSIKPLLKNSKFSAIIKPSHTKNSISAFISPSYSRLNTPKTSKNSSFQRNSEFSSSHITNNTKNEKFKLQIKEYSRNLMKCIQNEKIITEDLYFLNENIKKTGAQQLELNDSVSILMLLTEEIRIIGKNKKIPEFMQNHLETKAKLLFSHTSQVKSAKSFENAQIILHKIIANCSARFFNVKSR